MSKTILIISTLDTKGEETLYLQGKIASLGLDTLMMDLSMRGGKESQAENTPAMVAKAGGSTLEALGASRERSQITAITIAGAIKLAAQYHAAGKVGGVVALGGSTGSLMASEVMRALPFGLPKVIISSTAALPGLSTRYIGTGDIMLFHSVIEISGVSNLLKNVIDRAAGALMGMVNSDVASPVADNNHAIAMTMLGPCEQCAHSVRRGLEKSGYQVTGFSAAGISDRAMEEMITRGFFKGVIELAPGGVGEHLFGYMRDAGPTRMEAAGRAGIPQIISLCSVNHMTPAKSKYKPDFNTRRKYDLDKFRTWIRLAPVELEQVADAFAQKLNTAKGPVIVIVPLKGWSGVDIPGNPTYDPKEDAVFTHRLQEKLSDGIEIREIDANMEEEAVARAVIAAAIEIMP